MRASGLATEQSVKVILSPSLEVTQEKIGISGDVHWTHFQVELDNLNQAAAVSARYLGGNHVRIPPILSAQVPVKLA